MQSGSKKIKDLLSLTKTVQNKELFKRTRSFMNVSSLIWTDCLNKQSINETKIPTVTLEELQRLSARVEVCAASQSGKNENRWSSASVSGKSWKRLSKRDWVRRDEAFSQTFKRLKTSWRKHGDGGNIEMEETLGWDARLENRKLEEADGAKREKIWKQQLKPELKLIYQQHKTLIYLEM